MVGQVKALVPAQKDREERLRGPPAKAAFDKEGNPTKVSPDHNPREERKRKPNPHPHPIAHLGWACLGWGKP